MDVYNRGDAGRLLTLQSKKSSVLLALCEREGEIYVVLTRRASKMRKHAGQVAFPGGKNEDTDVNDYNCAIREAYEEMRFPSLNEAPLEHLSKGKQVRYVLTNEVVDVLDFHIEPTPPHYVTIRMPDGREKQTTTERLTVKGVEFVCEMERLAQPNFTPPMVVTPVVVKMDYEAVYSQLVPNEDECNAVFLAPLSMFLKESTEHSVFELKHKTGTYRMHHFNVKGDGGGGGDGRGDEGDGEGGDGGEVFDVWGMTADVIIRVASVVYQQRPQFSLNASEDHLYPKSHDFVHIQKSTTNPSSKM